MEIVIPSEGRRIPPYFRMGSQTRLQGQLLNVVMRPSMLPWSFMEEQRKTHVLPLRACLIPYAKGVS